jgi:hypothetical protein
MIQTRRRLAEEGMQAYFSFFFSVRCNVCQRRYIFRSMETSALTQHHHSYYSAAKMFIHYPFCARFETKHVAAEVSCNSNNSKNQKPDTISPWNYRCHVV